MPLYEYECTACHKRTEKIQKFSDPEITACPACGGVLKRVISAPAIAFKGGGWYADGYGNAKPATSTESKSEAGGKVETSPSAGTENKTTSTAESTVPAAAATPAAPTAPASPAKP